MTLTLDAPLLRVPDYPHQSVLDRALNVIFPPTCVGCRRVGRWICERCWLRMSWLEEDECSACSRKWVRTPCFYCERGARWLESTAGVCTFETTARDAVHALKYHGRHAISGLMGRLMGQAVQAEGLTLVTHVPLHASRRRERGYDQAAMLARHVAKYLDLPFDDKLLKRIRRTKQQVGLDSKQRAENMREAFRAASTAECECVLLVDDVFTTGATLDSAAQALRDAGAASVSGVVFATALVGADGSDQPISNP